MPFLLWITTIEQKNIAKSFLKTNLIFKENLIIDIIRYEQKGKRSEKYVSKNTKKEF